jgi:hypothetical protein
MKPGQCTNAQIVCYAGTDIPLTPNISVQKLRKVRLNPISKLPTHPPAPCLHHPSTLAGRELRRTIRIIHKVLDVILDTRRARLLRRCKARINVARDVHYTAAGLGLRDGVVATVASCATAFEHVGEAEPMANWGMLVGIWREDGVKEGAYSRGLGFLQ